MSNNKLDKLRGIFIKIKYLDLNRENLDLIEKNKLIEEEFIKFFKLKDKGGILGIGDIFIREDFNIISSIYWDRCSEELDIYN